MTKARMAKMRKNPKGTIPRVLPVLSATDFVSSIKDRRAKPHKLADAIKAYNLADRVQNSHRAIDDVEALFGVCRAMAKERDDLLSYVNVFGYNSKYGEPGPGLCGVTYFPQRSADKMQPPSETLPARCKKITHN